MQLVYKADEKDLVTQVKREISSQIADWQEDRKFAVKLSLEEAVTNAVKHGNEYQGEIRILYIVDEKHLTLFVFDEGRNKKGFDPDNLPDPTADENLSKPTNRGILLMKAYADGVIYNRARDVVMLKFSREK